MSEIDQQSLRKQEKRPYRVDVRFSPEEYGHLRAQCRIANLGPAKMLRRLAAGAQLRPSTRLPEDVHRAIKSFGGNLNQLAHQANLGRVDKRDVEDVRKQVGELLRAIQG